MAQLGLVLVDVPTRQTNDPYSYLIPDQLVDQVVPGIRVVVPFGRGGRLVQGLVVGLTTRTEFDGQLKPIQAVMDLAPVLNDELLTLADWLAETTYAFRMTCVQTMLPSAMRAKYQKQLRRLHPLPAATQQHFFGDHDLVPFQPDALTNEEMATLLSLKAAGDIDMVYQVSDRSAVKTLPVIRLAMSPKDAYQLSESIAARAPKQARLLTALAQVKDDHPQFQRDILRQTGLSAAIVRTAVQKGWVIRQEQEVYRDPMQRPAPATTAKTLTSEQMTVVSAIDQVIDQQTTQTFLVEGVTGSGKTEVYLQAMAHALQQGRTALMLVPEIALTPQMVQRVRGRFGATVAVLHSGLSTGERYDEWRRIERGEAHVVVGARSAVFAPLTNLGIIIMDEEHEASYKQEDNPRYHARDVAQWRGAYHHCPVVLGSATPSLESRARATKGVYQLLRLTARINQMALPQVTVVDMREAMKTQPEGDFSQPMLTAIADRLEKGEQTVLMLNRRGFSSFVMCRDCGFVLKCPNCDISLTLHMDTHSMKCHYCGHEESIPRICPNCHSDRIRYYGTGTQKVEQTLQAKFPTARILRMDVDVTRKKGAHARILRQFGQHQADILLGTQMIAKGLDFPDVTLVGVLNADTALGLPDFRASERTFDLLTQVSGRAGRAQKPGTVIVQTFNPDHYAIQLASRQDYERFFVTEMAYRHQGHYPPYYFAVQITASHEEEAKAAKAMYQIAQMLKSQLSDQAIMLGPTPTAIARVKRKYYYQIVVKYKHEPRLGAALTTLQTDLQQLGIRGLNVAIDPDPMNFM